MCVCVYVYVCVFICVFMCVFMHVFVSVYVCIILASVTTERYIDCPYYRRLRLIRYWKRMMMPRVNQRPHPLSRLK